VSQLIVGSALTYFILLAVTQDNISTIFNISKTVKDIEKTPTQIYKVFRFYIDKVFYFF